MKTTAIAACGLLLVLLQTVVVPALGRAGGFYDLLLPWVIHLGLFRPLRQGLPGVLFVGLLLDHLSGAPFGVFLTVYLWSFLGVRLLRRVLRAETPGVAAVLLPGAVLFENLFFLLVMELAGEARPLARDFLREAGAQLGWALLTGLPLAALMVGLERGFSGRRRRGPAAEGVP
ncbi:MAG: hypothetical protein WHT06_14365 [Desulfobacterales bacterium]